MKVFIDCEFIEDGRTIKLLSLGGVTEEGVEFYAETEYSASRQARNDASEWVLNNVFPHLLGGSAIRPRAKLAIEFYDFAMSGQDFPVFWGYYPSYDWVAICQLYGTMMQLPTGFPKLCKDLKQWADQLGNPRLPEQLGVEHHALADARWNHQAHTFLEQCQAELWVRRR